MERPFAALTCKSSLFWIHRRTLIARADTSSSPPPPLPTLPTVTSIDVTDVVARALITLPGRGACYPTHDVIDALLFPKVHNIVITIINTIIHHDGSTRSRLNFGTDTTAAELSPELSPERCNHNAGGNCNSNRRKQGLCRGGQQRTARTLAAAATTTGHGPQNPPKVAPCHNAHHEKPHGPIWLRLLLLLLLLLLLILLLLRLLLLLLLLIFVSADSTRGLGTGTPNLAFSIIFARRAIHVNDLDSRSSDGRHHEGQLMPRVDASS